MRIVGLLALSTCALLPRASVCQSYEGARPVLLAMLSPAATATEAAAKELAIGASGLPDAPTPNETLVGVRILGAGAPRRTDAANEQMHEDKVRSETERNTACENHTLSGKPCRVSWTRVLPESLFFLAAQHGGNIAFDSDTRNALTRGDFWGRYEYCVQHYRWWRWKDDDPFGVDYIGHPMMGAFTSSIYEQNDPKQRALTYENTKRYWVGRLRAMAYSAAYSAQWKVGPFSEASIGNTGQGYYVRHRDGVYTNETGMQDFFVTPIGGMAWNVGEDVIDKYILSRIRHHTKNRGVLLLSSFMTPARSGANCTRFRAPYYRDLDEESAAVAQK